MARDGSRVFGSRTKILSITAHQRLRGFALEQKSNTRWITAREGLRTRGLA
jgi:hypothetical protein